MQLTNRLNLPAPILRAIHNDKYDRGDSDITVTELIGPAQIRHLKKKHAAELTEDAADRVWSMLGSAMHSVLEDIAKGDPNLVAEKRLYVDMGVDETSVMLGGQFDIYDRELHELTDYKVTSVWNALGKQEWEEQLNVLAFLLAINNYGKPRSLRVIAILRDWQKRMANTGEYPRCQVVNIEVKQWPDGAASEYIIKRLREHLQDPPPPCTDEERWTEPASFAVMKKNTKKAIRVFKSKEEALEWAGDRMEYSVFDRPAQYRRCEAYCPVALHCPQWAAELAKAPF